MNICPLLDAIGKDKIKKDYLEGAFNFRPRYNNIEIDWKDKFNRFMPKKNLPNNMKNLKTLFAIDDSE